MSVSTTTSNQRININSEKSLIDNLQKKSYVVRYPVTTMYLAHYYNLN